MPIVRRDTRVLRRRAHPLQSLGDRASCGQSTDRTGGPRRWYRRAVRSLLLAVSLALAAAACGTTIHGSWEGALAPLHEACDHGVGAACLGLGIRYDTGSDGVDKDPARAAHFYQLA